jgi:hypothetical protein
MIFLIKGLIGFHFPFAVSKTASGESGQNNGGLWVAGA